MPEKDSSCEMQELTDIQKSLIQKTQIVYPKLEGFRATEETLKAAIVLRSKEHRQNIPNWKVLVAHSYRELLYNTSENHSFVALGTNLIAHKHPGTTPAHNIKDLLGSYYGFFSDVAHHNISNESTIKNVGSILGIKRLTKISDSEFITMCNRFEEELDKFLGSKKDILDELDQYFENEISEDVIKKILECFKVSPGTKQYFFQKAPLQWFHALQRHGFFQDLLKPVSEEERPFREPAIIYIRRLAEKAPSEFLTFTQSVTMSERTRGELVFTLLDRMSVLPEKEFLEICTRLILEDWLSYVKPPYYASELCKVIARKLYVLKGTSKDYTNLALYLLKPIEPTNDAQPTGYLKVKRSHLSDGFLEDILNPVIQFSSSELIGFLERLSPVYLSYFSTMPRQDRPSPDFKLKVIDNGVFLRDMEYYESDRSNKQINDQLIAFFKRSSEKLLQSEAEKNERAIGDMLTTIDKVLPLTQMMVELRLYLTTLYPAALRDSAYTLLMRYSHISYDRIFSSYHYSQSLHLYFKIFAKEKQNKLLERILSNEFTNSDNLCRAQTYVISCIVEFLSPQWKKTIEEKLGKELHQRIIESPSSLSLNQEPWDREVDTFDYAHSSIQEILVRLHDAEKPEKGISYGKIEKDIEIARKKYIPFLEEILSSDVSIKVIDTVIKGLHATNPDIWLNELEDMIPSLFKGIDALYKRVKSDSHILLEPAHEKNAYQRKGLLMLVTTIGKFLDSLILREESPKKKLCTEYHETLWEWACLFVETPFTTTEEEKKKFSAYDPKKDPSDLLVSSYISIPGIGLRLASTLLYESVPNKNQWPGENHSFTQKERSFFERCMRDDRLVTSYILGRVTSILLFDKVWFESCITQIFRSPEKHPNHFFAAWQGYLAHPTLSTETIDILWPLYEKAIKKRKAEYPLWQQIPQKGLNYDLPDLDYQLGFIVGQAYLIEIIHIDDGRWTFFFDNADENKQLAFCILLRKALRELNNNDRRLKAWVPKVMEAVEWMKKQPSTTEKIKSFILDVLSTQCEAPLKERLQLMNEIIHSLQEVDGNNLRHFYFQIKSAANELPNETFQILLSLKGRLIKQYYDEWYYGPKSYGYIAIEILFKKLPKKSSELRQFISYIIQNGGDESLRALK